MASHIVHELLFNLVNSDRLIFEATCWRRADRENNGPAHPPKRKPFDTRSYQKPEFKKADHIAVDLVLCLIKALEVPNSIAKNDEFEEAKKVNHIKAFVSRSLMLHWVDLWAKNAEWKKYEAALLATGFIINEGCRDLFESVMFENKRYVDGEFSPQYFPLFQDFQENYRLISNSGLFESTYEGYYHQKAKSLDIVNWFERMEIDVPTRLIERVRKFQTSVSNSASENPSEHYKPKLQRSESDNNKLNVRERESLLLMINAMAKAKFGFEPHKSFGPAIQRIDTAIRDTEASLSDKTIRRYLKESEEALKAYLERKKQ